MRSNGDTKPAEPPATTRGFWPLRDLPVVFWLVAVIVVALTQPAFVAPRWLMIHLLLLGAATHAIVVWSKHFADALLHTPRRPADRRIQSVRLSLLNAAALAVVSGVQVDVWPLTAVGAVGFVAAVGWHGTALVRQLQRALPAPYAFTVHFYVAAAAFLPFGALLGSLLARGLADPAHQQLKLAHATVNLLGWIGFPIVGTLLTLWPTMLRTRMADNAASATRRALPVLVVSIVASSVAALIGHRALAGVGLVGYLGGLALVAPPFVSTARRKRPASYPTWSVFAGMCWLALCLSALSFGVATSPSWVVADRRFSAIAPFLAAGFVAQVLIGALSFLVPMALGGGPRALRATNHAIEYGGALRIAIINAGLVVCALPVPNAVRVACWLLVLGAFAAFIPMLFASMRAWRRAKHSLASDGMHSEAVTPPGADSRSGDRRAAAIGVLVVLLASGLGLGIDAKQSGGANADRLGNGESTSPATRVDVRARQLRFSPQTLAVRPGSRLVVSLTNDDQIVHDLVLESGSRTPRIAGAATAELDSGVIWADVQGWCSVLGHREAGMTFRILVDDNAPLSR